jgi:hypothetical protein
LPTHPLLEQLDVVLRDLISPDRVFVTGEWSAAPRRTYESAAQVGSGAGPFVDVVDLRWRGVLMSPAPISGIAFLLTQTDLYWAKAPEVSESLSVGVSLHAYADHTSGGATFSANMGGAYLPGVAVTVHSKLEEVCALGQSSVRTGRVSCIAEANGVAFFVLLFQRGVIKVGRKRLWHVREVIASSLPPTPSELLTRRRSGVFPVPR